jgi:hypothetical protein
MPNDKANDVFIRVFLNSDTRTQFKVLCAQSGVAMSEKARELIEEWVMQHKQPPASADTSAKDSDGKGRGKKGDGSK